MSVIHTEQLMRWPQRFPRHNNPVGRRPPGRAPSVFELIETPAVRQALTQAWTNTRIGRTHEHEEGGWVYMNLGTGEVTTQQAPAGTSGEIDLNSPRPVPGSVVVATFHTHPSSGAYTGPSERDLRISRERHVPGIVRATDGLHLYGMEGRMGEWRTAAQYPAFPPHGSRW